jgi:DNA-binding GntR family transcriptional regulator
MRTHRTPEGLKEHALLDRAVLNLMLDPDRQRPWSEDELARTLGVPGDVRESLRRLRACKLIHRWNDLAVAAHAAVRFHEISQIIGRLSPGDFLERDWEQAVLEILLARSVDGEGPCTEQQLYEAFGATKRKKQLKIADALDRLEGAGLIERRGGRSIASEVARCLSELMTV